VAWNTREVISPKEFTHHANSECLVCCLIQLYKHYCSHWPECQRQHFYLAFIPNAKGNEYGVKVKPMEFCWNGKCKKEWQATRRTMHSDGVTATTTLYHSGMDEQLITGQVNNILMELELKRLSSKSRHGIPASHSWVFPG